MEKTGIPTGVGKPTNTDAGKPTKEGNHGKKAPATQAAMASVREYKKVFYHHNKLVYCVAMVSTALNAMLSVLLAVILKELLDVAIGGDIQELLDLVVTSLVFLAVLVAVWLICRESKFRFVKRAVEGYRNKAYGDITRKSISVFSRENTGNYISALTNDVTSVENNYLLAQFDILSQLVFAPVAFVLMLWYSWSMTLVVLLLCALPVVAAMAVGGRMTQIEKTVSGKNASFMAMVKDLLSGFAVIKSFQAQEETAALYREKNLQLEQVKCTRRKTEEMISIITTTAGFIMQMGVFVFGAYLCIRGQITPGVVIAFVQMMNYVLSPINTLPKLFANRKAALGLMEKMAAYGAGQENGADGQKGVSHRKSPDISGAQKSGGVSRQDARNLVPFQGLQEGGQGIALQHVTFSYEEDKEVLKDINLEFEAGKSYAIVGGSGSGKSTLLNLVMGSYPEYTGQITLGGTELGQIDPDSIFDAMSVIQQNVFIFDDTIRQNICMFKEFDEGRLDMAIQRAGLARLIEEKGEDYDCGENGAHLSGGEKQRISIARSLLREVSVLLVDEATSALDAATSDSVTNALLDIKGVTRLVVTHKLDEKALKRFDEIIVMKNGQVAEQGDFNTLMGKGAYFASLYQISRE